LNNIRRTDYFGRFGGEEFLIVCMHTSLNNAEILAGKLKHIIENNQFIYKDNKIKVTASFGLSSNEGQVDNVNKLLKLTDEALYDAKRAGRNCIKKRT
jgi:diguanylate cyclase (GGDEF)-like protein